MRTPLIHGERVSGGLLDLLPPDPRTLAVEGGEALILHLCADTGSDTWPYQQDPKYKVVRIGSDVGVENYSPPSVRLVRGIGANPVCTHFSTLRRGPGITPSNPEDGMGLVRECLRVIEEAEPVWWSMFVRAGARRWRGCTSPRSTTSLSSGTPGMPAPTTDAEMRSLCSQGFARAFKEANP